MAGDGSDDRERKRWKPTTAWQWAQPPRHFVQATAPPEQLTEVLAALQLSPDPARRFTRCSRCNTRLETVEETLVRDRLPEGVRAREQVILRCPDCDQLYWRGSHTDRILGELAR